MENQTFTPEEIVDQIKSGERSNQLSESEFLELAAAGLLHFLPTGEDKGIYAVGGGRLKKPVTFAFDTEEA